LERRGEGLRHREVVAGLVQDFRQNVLRERRTLAELLPRLPPCEVVELDAELGEAMPPPRVPRERFALLRPKSVKDVRGSESNCEQDSRKI
jgi:hypothetical protein